MGVSAVNFIAKFEGYAAKAYWDYKQWSYGYGSKAPSSTSTINKADALKLLQQRIDADTIQIKNNLSRSVSRNALTALLSFNYNLGFGNTIKLINDLNAGKTFQEVANRLKTFVYAGGVIHPALVSRRINEANLLIS